MRQMPIVYYAIWTDSRKGAKILEQGLRAIYEMDTRDPLRFRFMNAQAESAYQPFLKMSASLYLLRAWESWSPGDICGFLKMQKFVLPDANLMAFRISSEYYIPHHGLSDPLLKNALERFLHQEETLVLPPH